MSKFFMYYSLVSSISYFISSIIFFHKYHSIEGGIWAALASLVAGITFYHYKSRLANNLYAFFTIQSLDYWATGSYMVCLIGLGFGAWYLFATLYWKDLMVASSKTTVFPCVFSFLTGKWGFHLYRATIKSLNEIMEASFIPLVRDA